MEQIIEQIKDKKAQIAGAIMDCDNTLSKTEKDVIASKREVLEAQADLYDAMLELAKAFSQLRDNVNGLANLQKNNEI